MDGGDWRKSPATDVVRRDTTGGTARTTRKPVRETGPAAGPAITPVARKSQSHVGELLIKEDALYVTEEVGDVELEWLLDTGCSLSLISTDVYKRIPEAVRPRLDVNDVDMATADGSRLSDLGKVHLKSKSRH